MAVKDLGLEGVSIPFHKIMKNSSLRTIMSSDISTHMKSRINTLKPIRKKNMVTSLIHLAIDYEQTIK